ncbi:MAG: prepilin-type N-terminal cleavage/methylation domain-containing protein [Chlorobium sp.]|nr:prepilin-type N-terminal cleavage/methylation domain-containing protein [Chlorobium sp.]
MIFSVRQKGNERGFTLVELMIAVAVGGIVMAAVMTSFLSQHRSYLAQDEVVEMQQNARVAMDMLTRDIRSAGFDPNNLGAGITTATPNNLIFTREDDLAANGLETVNYSLFDAFTFTVPPSNDGLVDDLALQVTSALGASAGRQVVAENIEQLEFRYLDEDGNVTANLADIRAIQISILAVARNPDQNFTNTMTYTTASGAVWDPVDDNLRRRLLITTVQCRNLGL